MERKIYQGCKRCDDVLQRSEWLLDPVDWELEKLGSGGNGQVYKATCSETRCEHVAKFLPYRRGKWECAMTEQVQQVQSRHIVRAICSGLTRNPLEVKTNAQPKIVLLLELMSEDLFEAVFEPSLLSRRLFSKSCTLKHIAYQVLQGVQAIHEARVVHDDVKMENLMVKYLPGCGLIKVGDFGNAVPVANMHRIGGTLAYSAPENVVGLMNRGQLGDIFASGMILVEIFCRSTLIPDSLLAAYQRTADHRSQADTRRWAQLYHLVLLSSLIEQRPVYAGVIVRRYFGNFAKARVQKALESCCFELEEDLYAVVAKLRWIKQADPNFFRFVRFLLTKEEQRPTADMALKHDWFRNKAAALRGETQTIIRHCPMYARDMSKREKTNMCHRRSLCGRDSSQCSGNNTTTTLQKGGKTKATNRVSKTIRTANTSKGRQSLMKRDVRLFIDEHGHARVVNGRPKYGKTAQSATRKLSRLANTFASSKASDVTSLIAQLDATYKAILAPLKKLENRAISTAFHDNLSTVYE
ncbi:hypothetical protein Q7P37_009700 [Cladosporium fusiforme]